MKSFLSPYNRNPNLDTGRSTDTQTVLYSPMRELKAIRRIARINVPKYSNHELLQDPKII